MNDLVILRYTEEALLDSVYEAFINFKKAEPSKTIIAIPYSIDVLEDCPLEQLYEIKNIIDNAIKEKEQKDG